MNAYYEIKENIRWSYKMVLWSYGPMVLCLTESQLLKKKRSTQNRDCSTLVKKLSKKDDWLTYEKGDRIRCNFLSYQSFLFETCQAFMVWPVHPFSSILLNNLIFYGKLFKGVFIFGNIVVYHLIIQQIYYF